jgi:hypothetical protein
MSGDRIDAQGSQGFVNNPQGSVDLRYGDETNINAGGGDVGLRDVNKPTFIFNLLGGYSNLNSESKLIEELRKFLSNTGDLEPAIRAAYQSAFALLLDADAYPIGCDQNLM